MAEPEKHIMIVGAGLAGALMACYLGGAGYRVAVFERRPDPRVHGFLGGRSINLALSTRGITALEEVGLAEEVLSQAIPMRGRMMHPPSAAAGLTFQPYSANPEDAINSVSRGGLNITLLNAAESHENVSLHFDHQCLNVDLDVPMVSFENVRTKEFVQMRADVIIGADGAFSAVRGRLQKEDRFNYSQQYLEHGYKELTIPPAEEIPGFAGGEYDGFAMEPNALHIWPRGGAMMIALPNIDRSFTCTCFWPYRAPAPAPGTGEIGFDQVQSESDVVPFFEKHFPDAVPLMPTLAHDYMHNPTSSLATIRCFPWHYRDKVVILGDAAHAIVPFFGQGMNAAFEDCRILNEYIERFAPHWDAILETFTMKRKVHADAIADMALANFIEMRDKVGSKRFLLWKKTEQTLHRWFPKSFTPLYNMISFSNVPYAEAKRRAEGQVRLVKAAGIGLALSFIVIVLVLLAVLF